MIKLTNLTQNIINVTLEDIRTGQTVKIKEILKHAYDIYHVIPITVYK